MNDSLWSKCCRNQNKRLSENLSNMPPKRKKVGRGRPPCIKNKKHITIRGRPKMSTKEKIKNVALKCCDGCEKTFKTQSSLESHRSKCKRKINLHSGIALKPTHCCKECNKKFRFVESYEAHLHNEHSKLPGSVPCKLCSVTCPDEDTLSNHVLKYHERKIFKCPECKKKFTRKFHVIRHMTQKGCNGKGVTLFTCEICDASFSRKDNLMVHLRMQHINLKRFKCKQCDYHTKSFSKLIIHTQKKHSENPNHFECDHCGKVTGSRAAIAKHLEIHGEKKYSCDVCGYATYTLEVMRRHVFTHVPEKPFKCSFCKKSYIQRCQLEKHLDRHTGHICIECGKVCSNKYELLIHNREHTGLNKLFCPFKKCIYFTKELASEDVLKTHLRTHVQDKMYQCEICPKKFPSLNIMRKHLSTHTLERPRRCMYCLTSRAYTRGEHLARHVRANHPNIFRDHLRHVRRVLGLHLESERVTKSELESIINVLDAESDRILECYGPGVLYGGMVEQDETNLSEIQSLNMKSEDGPLMSEEELAANLEKLLVQLIDKEMLDVFGWPEESVDTVLEKVIENCGGRAAERDKWTRVQRLRENAKHLFVYAVEDKNIARMLDTHTIDQIVKHILEQVEDPDS